MDVVSLKKDRILKIALELMVICVLTITCNIQPGLRDYGLAYQQKGDYHSLRQVVDLLPSDADTALVRAILGAPIDMGFDYRYLIDSVGPNNCVIGAVFHINELGKIDQKWLDEICE